MELAIKRVSSSTPTEVRAIPADLQATLGSSASYWDYNGLSANTRYCFQGRQR